MQANNCFPFKANFWGDFINAFIFYLFQIAKSKEGLLFFEKQYFEYMWDQSFQIKISIVKFAGASSWLKSFEISASS